MRKIRRAALITGLAGVLFLSAVPCLAYNDIHNQELQQGVEELSQYGVISGYTDGSFRPEQSVTRAEFAKMIVVASNNEFLAFQDTGFGDVEADSWALSYIGVAKQLGIINGTAADSFAPQGKVSLEQAVKMTVSALGYEQEASQKGGYPSGYIAVARELKLLDDQRVIENKPASRGDIADLLCKALAVPYYHLFSVNGSVERDKAEGTLRDVLLQKKEQDAFILSDDELNNLAEVVSEEALPDSSGEPAG